MSGKKAVVIGSGLGGSGIPALLAHSGDYQADLDEPFIEDKTMIWYSGSEDLASRKEDLEEGIIPDSAIMSCGRS